MQDMLGKFLDAIDFSAVSDSLNVFYGKLHIKAL